MKLVLQIALGVFLGTLTSEFTIDSWRIHQQELAKEALEQQRTKQEKVRLEQVEHIRALLRQGRQENSSVENKRPTVYVPDDSQEMPIGE